MKAAKTTTGEELRIPLDLIVVSSLKQPRTEAHRNSLEELTASIKESGVLQPVVVRKRVDTTGAGDKFELICGERRFLSSKKAGLDDIPAVVRDLTDDEARVAQMVENLQREDLHALDEAVYYQRMLDVAQVNAAELARRVAKSETYIARRLSLNLLIPEARKDFAGNLMTLGHALELSRLSPQIQSGALNEGGVYETTWSQKTKKQIPVKTLLRTVGKLTDWLKENTDHSLDKAPWKLDDAELVPKLGACLTCQYRTGTNAALFPDAVDGNICTNALGYAAKREAWIMRAFATAEAADGKKPLFASTQHYLDHDDRKGLPKGTITRDSYTAVEGKRKCEYAQTAVLVDSDAFGSTLLICISAKCKDHRGRVNATSSHSSSSNGSGAKSGPELRRRKQELFDIKVAEAARRQILRDMLPKLKWPLSREWLNNIAAEYLSRIPSKTLDVLMEVFGRDDLSGFSSDIDSKTLPKIEKLKDSELAQLLVLMSVVHWGENEYMNNPVNQRKVIALADKLKLNYRLRDAEARMTFVSRKAREVHEHYLEEVKAGRTPSKPSIFVDAKPTLKKAKGKTKTKAVGKTTTKKAARGKARGAAAGK